MFQLASRRLPARPPYDKDVDAAAIVALIEGRPRKVPVPEALVIEHYLARYRMRAEAAERLLGANDPSPPRAAQVEAGLSEPDDLVDYQDARRQLDARLGQRQGYLFSWGVLIESIRPDGPSWEVLPGEILRHFQRAGMTWGALCFHAGHWSIRPPTGVFVDAGDLGILTVRANVAEVGVSQAVDWVGNVFLSRTFPAFLDYAASVAARDETTVAQTG